MFNHSGYFIHYCIDIYNSQNELIYTQFVQVLVKMTYLNLKIIVDKKL